MTRAARASSSMTQAPASMRINSPTSSIGSSDRPTEAAPGSASRSRSVWSRRTAARSGRAPRPAAARACGSAYRPTAAVGSIDRMSLEITRGGVDDIDSVEPLWVAVHHAHQAAMPELAPYVDDEQTWREHRPLYVSLFKRADTFLFLARVNGELVGYALGCVAPAAEGWAADTWQVGDRIGELESLSVLPDHRRGHRLRPVGRRRARVREPRGRRHRHRRAPGNAGALKLYERRGFKPTWIYLSRFAAREGRTRT